MIKLRRQVNNQTQAYTEWNKQSPIRPVKMVKAAKIAFINKPLSEDDEEKLPKLSPRTKMRLEKEQYKKDLVSIVKDCNLQNIGTQRAMAQIQEGIDIIKIKDG